MGYLVREKDNLYLCFLLEENREAKLLKMSAGKGNWSFEKMEQECNSCRIVDILPPVPKVLPLEVLKIFMTNRL